MFQNPMMLLMLGMGGLVVAMPYLMVRWGTANVTVELFLTIRHQQKNMDPAMLQDFQKRQARIGSLQSSLQSGDLSGG